MQKQVKFDEVDADGSGDLDPDELIPIIQEAAAAKGMEVSHDQAEAFCKIFDDDGNGTVPKQLCLTTSQLLYGLALPPPPISSSSFLPTYGFLALLTHHNSPSWQPFRAQACWTARSS